MRMVYVGHKAEPFDQNREILDHRKAAVEAAESGDYIAISAEHWIGNRPISGLSTTKRINGFPASSMIKSLSASASNLASAHTCRRAAKSLAADRYVDPGYGESTNSGVSPTELL